MAKVAFICLLLCACILISEANVLARALRNRASKSSSKTRGFWDWVVETVEDFGAHQDDSCKKTCPDGSTPVDNPNHDSTSNGCGSYGLTMDTTRWPKLGACCDDHDYCYGTCNTGRYNCDSQFKTCLEKACAAKARLPFMANSKDFLECDTMATGMYTTVFALGCSAYEAAQGRACLCV